MLTGVKVMGLLLQCRPPAQWRSKRGGRDGMLRAAIRSRGTSGGDSGGTRHIATFGQQNCSLPSD